jgi:uncharacterized protein YjiS (DUF1127 family)
MPILAALRRWRDHHAARRSLARLLAKPDDHLIHDIGLTRTEVEAMLAGMDAHPQFINMCDAKGENPAV